MVWPLSGPCAMMLEGNTSHSASFYFALASGEIDVKFALAGNLSKADVIAIIADDTDRSNVLRGENSGRQLQHVSVARSMTRVATVRNDSEQSVHVSSPGRAFDRQRLGPSPDPHRPGAGSTG